MPRSEPVKVVGLGAGGHAKVVIDALNRRGGHHIVGLLDSSPSLVGRTVMGLQVLGGEELLAGLGARGVRSVFIGVGGASDNVVRQGVYLRAIAAGLEVIRVVHPSAVVSESAFIGAGTVVFAGAVVNADAKIAENVIVNTGAIVEHDCEIDPHAHVAPGAILSGGAIVGACTLVGAGAVVRHGIRIGHGCVIGAGAVVVRDLQDGCIVVGVSARMKRK